MRKTTKKKQFIPKNVFVQDSLKTVPMSKLAKSSRSKGAFYDGIVYRDIDAEVVVGKIQKKYRVYFGDPDRGEQIQAIKYNPLLIPKLVPESKVYLRDVRSNNVKKMINMSKKLFNKLLKIKGVDVCSEILAKTPNIEFETNEFYMYQLSISTQLRAIWKPLKWVSKQAKTCIFNFQTIGTKGGRKGAYLSDVWTRGTQLSYSSQKIVWLATFRKDLGLSAMGENNGRQTKVDGHVIEQVYNLPLITYNYDLSEQHLEIFLAIDPQIDEMPEFCEQWAKKFKAKQK